MASTPLPSASCLVCGAALVPPPSNERRSCVLCGERKESETLCSKGHLACSGCLASPAKDLIERACAASDETEPIALALRLMRHPNVKVNGAEHHFLVPAVLVATLSNARGEASRRVERVAEARRRSEPVAGGFCGHQGACGAGVGAGIFVALATESTPLRGRERGLANRMTSRVLEVISRTGRARCCKRESFFALLSAVRFAREHLGVTLRAQAPACEWFEKNAECPGDACPFKR